jgi:hypothetical protein
MHVYNKYETPIRWQRNHTLHISSWHLSPSYLYFFSSYLIYSFPHPFYLFVLQSYTSPISFSPSFALKQFRYTWLKVWCYRRTMKITNYQPCYVCYFNVSFHVHVFCVCKKTYVYTLAFISTGNYRINDDSIQTAAICVLTGMRSV